MSAASASATSSRRARKHTSSSKYDGATSKAVNGCPKPYGTNNFPDIPAGLDAALPNTDGKHVYFFKGSQYWMYESLQAKVLAGYRPRSSPSPGNSPALPPPQMLRSPTRPMASRCIS
jgi:hypothetical protein